MKDINSVEWLPLVTRNISLLQNYFICLSKQEYYKLYGLNTSINVLYISIGTHVSMFKDKVTCQIFDDTIRKKVKNPNFSRNIKKLYFSLGKNLIKKAIICGKDDLKNKTQTVNNFKKFCDANSKLSFGLAYTSYIGNTLQDLTQERFKDEKLISILSMPNKLVPFMEQKYDLLRIGAKIQKRKKSKKWVQKELAKHNRKFRAIPVNFIDQPWDIKFFKEQLNELLKQDCDKKLKKLKVNHRKIRKKQDKITKKLSKKDKLLVEAAQTATYLNEYRKFIFCNTNLIIRPFLQRIAKKYGLKDWLEVTFLTPYEIIDLLKYGKVDKNIIKQRKKGYCLLILNKKIRLLNKKEQKYVLKNFQVKAPRKHKVTKKIKQVKGIIASTGKTTGIAKVIYSSKDFHRFKQGEILVAKMTSVDFMPIISKASAIVTDEGGITCHAAIVSREMGIPCVIGTKIATKVIKDGDLVEVDADNGVVKKL